MRVKNKADMFVAQISLDVGENDASLIFRYLRITWWHWELNGIHRLERFEYFSLTSSLNLYVYMAAYGLQDIFITVLPSLP
jgi:hypothetical protein